MLWYKSWLETRWRFFIGLGLLVLSAGGIVYAYPQVMKLLPRASELDTTGPLGQRIKDAVDLSRDYRGYVWSQWMRQNLVQMATFFAVILGSGGPYSQRSELFTLSLPVSRQRLVGIRAAAGLGELLVIIVLSSLVIPLCLAERRSELWRWHRRSFTRCARSWAARPSSASPRCCPHRSATSGAPC